MFKNTLTFKNVVFLLLSGLLTIGIFYYLLKTVSLTDVKQVIKEVDFRYLLAFMVLSLTGTAFRAWRYLLTLRPAGYQPPKLSLFLVTLVRNMCSDLVPARIGSAVYIYLANTRLGIPVSVATNSFALSLLFDLVALGPLVIVALLFTGDQFPLSKNILFTGAAVVFVITSLVVWFLPNCARLGSVLVERLPVIPRKWRTGLSDFAKQVAIECDNTRKYGTFFNIFVASCFVRLCKYASLYVFLVGMLIPLDFAPEQVSPVVSTVGILAAELAASLPISGIAGFGAYEGAWAFTFSLLGFPQDVAKLTAVAHHLFTQAWGYGIGLGALALLMLPVFLVQTSKIQLRPLARAFDISKQFVLFLFGVLLTLTAFSLPARSNGLPKVLNSEVPASEQKKLDNLSQLLPGQFYFDSNRSGSFGIYSINTDGTDIRAIVDHPKWHEVYPDISPDGKSIVYARTRSLARLAPSEVWIAAFDGSNARKIADDASFPTFDLDGKTIYLEKSRSTVHSYDLESGTSVEIFPKNRKAFKGRHVAKPRISPDRSAIAVTVDNPDRWHAWWAPLSKGKPAERIERGCEPTWFPDNNKMVWMKKTGAAAGSGIMYFYRDSKKKGVLKDDPGPLGHEYFPTVTQDGRYLMYSACPENQHDHLTSNYNIFVYDMQANTTWRVTFDGSTNRWPKYRAAVKE